MAEKIIYRVSAHSHSSGYGRVIYFASQEDAEASVMAFRRHLGYDAALHVQEIPVLDRPFDFVSDLEEKS